MVPGVSERERHAHEARRNDWIASAGVNGARQSGWGGSPARPTFRHLPHVSVVLREFISGATAALVSAQSARAKEPSRRERAIEGMKF
jgi:hypothetical protein